MATPLRIPDEVDFTLTSRARTNYTSQNKNSLPLFCNNLLWDRQSPDVNIVSCVLVDRPPPLSFLESDFGYRVPTIVRWVPPHLKGPRTYLDFCHGGELQPVASSRRQKLFRFLIVLRPNLDPAMPLRLQSDSQITLMRHGDKFA